MTDESHNFSTARARLEEIVSQVRKKDTSLEKSLDLLEEGVRLANACTELIDHQDWVSTAAPDAEDGAEPAAEAPDIPDAAPSAAVVPGDAGDSEEIIVIDGVAVIDDVVVTDDEGEFVAEVIEVRPIEQADAFLDADDGWGDETGLVIVDESDDPSAPEG